MSKELKLYHVHDDGNGHRYLIPKNEVNAFYNILDNLEESQMNTEMEMFTTMS